MDEVITQSKFRKFFMFFAKLVVFFVGILGNFAFLDYYFIRFTSIIPEISLLSIPITYLIMRYIK